MPQDTSLQVYWTSMPDCVVKGFLINICFIFWSTKFPKSCHDKCLLFINIQYIKKLHEIIYIHCKNIIDVIVMLSSVTVIIGRSLVN